MRWKRLLAGTIAATGLFVGLIGFAHTEPGRPLRPALVVLNKAMGAKPQAKGGACPLGYDQNGSPADVEAARQRSVAQFKGAAPSQRRPALGFSLGETTRQQVDAWITEHHLTCGARQGPTRVTCTGVPDSALPEGYRGLAIDELYLQYNPQDRLVSVGTVRSAQTPEPVSRAHGAVVAELTRQLGGPSSTAGQPETTYLAGGALRQARAEFRFSDYYATSSATNVGRGRFVVSERYEQLTDGS